MGITQKRLSAVALLALATAGSVALWNRRELRASQSGLAPSTQGSRPEPSPAALPTDQAPDQPGSIRAATPYTVSGGERSRARVKFHVRGPDGSALSTARVFRSAAGAPCVEVPVDGSGSFRLDGDHEPIAIVASGYMGMAQFTAKPGTTIELETAQAITVHLVDTTGEPVATELEIDGAMPLPLQGVGGPAQARWAIQGSSSLEIHTIPAAPGKGTLHARTEEGEVTWAGSWPDPGSTIKLAIGAGTRLYGRIADMPPGTADARVTARLASDGWDVQRSSVIASVDGTWQITGYTPSAEEAILLTLEHPRAEPDIASVPLDSWSRGSPVSVGLTWKDSIPLKVEVRDEFTSEPIPYPTVSVQWSTEAGWQKRVLKGDSGGFAQLTSAPSGQAWVRLLREGYSEVAHGPFALPDQQQNWIWIPAVHEASLRVCVTRDGIPLRNASISTFDPGGATETRKVSLDDDGCAVLTGLPRGTLNVQARAADGALSPFAQVDLGSSKEASIDIAVAPLGLAHGEVIDRKTGKPLAQATIASLVRGPGGQDRSDLGTMLTDANGKFSALPIAPGGSTIRATLEGYSQRSIRVRAVAGTDSTDAGVIALGEELSLTLRLDSRSALDPTQFDFAPAVDWLHQERQPFPADAKLNLHGLPAAELTGMNIVPPWVGLIEMTIDGPRNRDEEVLIPVDVGRTVRVNLDWDAVRHPEELFLRTTQDRPGLSITHTRSIDPRLPVDLTDLPPSLTYIEILDQEATIASHWADLRAPGDHMIKIPMDGLDLTLRFPGDWSNLGGPTWVDMAPAKTGGATLQLGAVKDAEIRTAGAPPGSYAVLYGDVDENYLGFQRIDLKEGQATFEIPASALSFQHFRSSSLGTSMAGADIRLSPLGHPGHSARLTIGANGLTRPIALSPGTYVAKVTSPLHWPDETTVIPSPTTDPIPVRIRLRGALLLTLPQPRPQIQVISLTENSTIEDWQTMFPALDPNAPTSTNQLLLSPLPAGPYQIRVQSGQTWIEHTVEVEPGAPTGFVVTRD